MINKQTITFSEMACPYCKTIGRWGIRLGNHMIEAKEIVFEVIGGPIEMTCRECYSVMRMRASRSKA